MVAMKFMMRWLLTILAFWVMCLGISTAASSVERYTDNKDGTITDTKTGLVWQKMDSITISRNL